MENVVGRREISRMEATPYHPPPAQEEYRRHSCLSYRRFPNLPPVQPRPSEIPDAGKNAGGTADKNV